MRVYCRIRPFLQNEEKNETPDGQSQFVYSVSDYKVILAMDQQPTKEYSFNHVFAPSASQEDVYKEIAPLIQSFLDGCDVFLMAYGQTGSGKSHTMHGLLSLCLENIALSCKEKDGSQPIIKASYYEIAGKRKNSQWINDLFDRKSQCKPSELTEKILPLDKQAELKRMFNKAESLRSTRTTKMNGASSRSHAVIKLTMITPDREGSCSLSFVDLAGSERGADEDALEESIFINSSLSHLKSVISAVAKGDVVDYRRSLLTQMLRPVFEGNGKMAMIVNISPTKVSMNETSQCLSFASLANTCVVETRGVATTSIQQN